MQVLQQGKLQKNDLYTTAELLRSEWQQHPVSLHCKTLINSLDIKTDGNVMRQTRIATVQRIALRYAPNPFQPQ